jgi:hypothetical protein
VGIILSRIFLLKVRPRENVRLKKVTLDEWVNDFRSPSLQQNLFLPAEYADHRKRASKPAVRAFWRSSLSMAERGRGRSYHFHPAGPPKWRGMRIDRGYQIPDAKAGLACGAARRRRIRDGGALTGPVQVAKKEYTFCIQEYTVNYILS